MKFTTTPEALSDAVFHIGSFSNGSMAIRLNADKVSLLAWDIPNASHFVTAFVDILECSSPGTLVVPIRLLTPLVSMVNEMGAETVEVECIQSESITIRANRFKGSIACWNEPEVIAPQGGPAGQPTLVPAQPFMSALRKAAVSIDRSGAHYALEGLALRPTDDGATLLMSSDTFRMSHVRLPFDVGLVRPVTLSLEAVEYLDKVVTDDVDELGFSWSEWTAKVSARRFEMVTSLIRVQFPYSPNIINERRPVRFTANRVMLAEAMRRMRIANGSACRFHVTPGALNLSATTILFDYSDSRGLVATENLPVDDDGTELRIALNPSFVEDVLSKLDSDRVCIRLGDDRSGLNPVEIVGVGDDIHASFIVMPVRLGAH